MQLAGPFEELQVPHGVVENVKFFACCQDEHIYRRVPARGPILNGVLVRDQIDTATPGGGVERQGLLDSEQRQRDAEDQCPVRAGGETGEANDDAEEGDVLQHEQPPLLAALEVPVLLCVGRGYGVPAVSTITSIGAGTGLR